MALHIVFYICKFKLPLQQKTGIGKKINIEGNEARVKSTCEIQWGKPFQSSYF
jgi:hypothetical protein